MLSIGGKVGFLIGSGTKVKYTENGSRKLNKNRYGYNLSSFRYGAVARLGYGPFTFWGYYRGNKMFKGNRTVDIENPGMFSFGILWQPSKGTYSPLNSMLEYESYLQEIAGSTRDYKEGVDAFLEKRKAEFKGE